MPAKRADQMEAVLNRLFRPLALLGVFPFRLKSGRLEITLLKGTYSFLMMAAYFTTAGTTDYGYAIGKTHFMQKLAKLGPPITLFVLIPTNVFWMWFNLRRLNAVLNRLKKLQDVTGCPMDYRYKSVLVYCFVVILQHIVDEGISGHLFTLQMLSLCAMMMIAFGIANQFVSLLKALKLSYTFIADSLTVRTAGNLTDIYQLLQGCCHDVNYCYAPQLLLVVLSIFVFNISGLYIIIVSFQDSGSIKFTYLNWTVLWCVIPFYFIRMCRLVTLEADRFNCLLYRLAINDDAKTLIRNKRIVLHFKNLQNLNFSALGLFNFDYPFICSMVSTTTTYLVIMVQFAFSN